MIALSFAMFNLKNHRVMKVYELNVFVDGDPTPENHLYPTLASAKWHAKEASTVEPVSEIWLRTWTLHREVGLFKIETNEQIFSR